MTIWLFSYGSNGPRQLSDRLGRQVKGYAAYARNLKRVYRGFSRNWQGAPASLIAKGGAIVYGNIVKVSAQELAVLDRYEGVSVGKYKRKLIQVFTRSGEPVPAVAYVSTSRVKGSPTRAYLEAVAENVGSFWRSSRNEKLRAEDFAPL